MECHNDAEQKKANRPPRIDDGFTVPQVSTRTTKSAFFQASRHGGGTSAGEYVHTGTE
jgi:hypothetical protein